MSTSKQVVQGQVSHVLSMFREESVGAILGKLIRGPKNFVQSARCRHRIKALKRDASIEKLVDFVYGCDGISVFQVRYELIEMLKEVQKRKPRTVVEIGTAGGGTLLLLCCLADKNATVASIDLPGGKFGGGYSAWKIPLYQDFAGKSQKLDLLRGNSHSDAMFQDLVSILAGKPIDFLFIDADHTYEGVKRDFQLYSSLVAKDGLIGFHDIAPIAPDGEYGVRQFWNELKLEYKCREIIADPKQQGFGIGLIEV
jgi:predicted O-methyltransferase YrrM